MIDAIAQKKSITNTIKLSIGNRVELTLQEERMLKSAYTYISGFSARSRYLSEIEKYKETIAALEARVEAEGRMEDLFEQRSIAQNFLAIAEEKFTVFKETDQKISIDDIDALLKNLGAPLSKRRLKHMIWEVDENGDGVIDYDEFLLTYHRNVRDNTGNEPCSFFQVLEFLTFDEHRKGYIIEDDCMEILFARYGSAKLEHELRLLFGKQLRAAGGDGTLNMKGYLASNLQRTGRRALVC